ncbi:MAG: hypothetical protein II306_02710 [Clostridia bacterium]|nr:hypothetical protein [Clostridia bacterium]
MNKTPKEKSAQILIRAKPKQKEKIKSLAEKCNLPVSEYMLQRALGYAVKAAVPDAFYIFNERLSELLNRDLSPEVEATALKLFDDIYAEFIEMTKQNKKQIVKEVASWQPQDSGPSSPD